MRTTEKIYCIISLLFNIKKKIKSKIFEHKLLLELNVKNTYIK